MEWEKADLIHNVGEIPGESEAKANYQQVIQHSCHKFGDALKKMQILSWYERSCFLTRWTWGCFSLQITVPALHALDLYSFWRSFTIFSSLGQSWSPSTACFIFRILFFCKISPFSFSVADTAHKNSPFLLLIQPIKIYSCHDTKKQWKQYEGHIIVPSDARC